ncbi:MAG: hypothetical protein OXT01_16675, partial [Rhodospirillaceae bacterium]|nr:hypothetical protein [Rhodospirillaceae bacterium]
MRITILLAGIAICFAGPASSQSDGIVEKFFGSYDGKGTWGTGTPPGAMSVVIKPHGNGFNITW